jgi:hypothetical protein
MAADAPPLLNVLRACDVPHVLGMLAPHKLTIVDSAADSLEPTTAAYAAAGAERQLTFK